MLNERLAYLMDRHVRQQLTEAEMAELRQMLGDGQFEEQVKAVIDHYGTQQLPGYKMREGASVEILEAILQVSSPAQEGVVRKLRFSRYMWWAAAVVIVCGAGFYFWQGLATKEKIAKTVVQPGLPGSNKAVLTLADGKDVALDDDSKQVIQQGNTVVQQKGGLLQYTGSENIAAVSYNTLSVPRGGQFQLVLPDGTKVWLNAASRLKYPTAFTAGRRVVELQGEAYFEVAPQAGRPFSVNVNNNEVVEVLGTDFNIMSYTNENQSVTTLVRGAVRVVSGGSQQMLRPGQQALVDKHTGEMKTAKADVDRALAWKAGFFELDNTDLPTLIRQLSRWYDVDIIDLSKGKTEGTFGGRISRKVNLRDVLHVLEQYGVHSRIEDNKVVIFSR